MHRAGHGLRRRRDGGGAVARHDRRGRAARADGDPQRRPGEGFRTASHARFRALVERALSGLDADLHRHIATAELVVEDVPDPDAPADPVDGVLLARLDLGGPRRPAVLTVWRRPLELRADSRADLVDAVEEAVRHAVQDALGMPRDDEDG
jgi:predicted Zn-dependent protease with MMP-like domain